MNQDLLRLIMTMNTSHQDFTHNLLNVIKYVMFCSKRALTPLEVRSEILERVGLEFTEQEIRRAISIGVQKDSIIKIDSSTFLLSDDEMQEIQKRDEDTFSKIISQYIQVYNVKSYKHNDIYDMIFEYVFWYMNTNMQILLSMLQNKKIEKVTDEYDCSNEKREIINNFIDWDNDEKNKILYNIISFAVDYCKMTVKKGNRAFTNFFEGKKFYLDANIIFRLIGINNKERQSVTRDFIRKCQESGITIVYTNITKDEIYSSLHYNINKLKTSANRLFVDPGKLKKFIPERDLNLDLYEMYYAWAVKKNAFGHFSDFEEYLKDAFLKEVADFSMEELHIPSKHNETIEELTIDLMSYKQRLDCEANPNKDTAEIDIKNLVYIRNLRTKKRGVNAWDIKEYIISADHKYAQWALSKFPQVSPYVSLPSVWYSLILKFNGRSGDDFKSFAEFIKLRYVQETSSLTSGILYEIGAITNERFLQDKIVDKLIESNELRIKETEGNDAPDAKDLVVKAKDEVLKQVEEKGYTEGMNDGKETGEKDGIAKGIESGKKMGHEEGRKAEYDRMIDVLVEERREFIMKLINTFSTFALIIAAAILLFLIYFLYIIIFKENNEALNPIEENINNYKGIIGFVGPTIGGISGFLGWGLKKVFDENKIIKRIRKKYMKKIPYIPLNNIDK